MDPQGLERAFDPDHGPEPTLNSEKVCQKGLKQARGTPQKKKTIPPVITREGVEQRVDKGIGVPVIKVHTSKTRAWVKRSPSREKTPTPRKAGNSSITKYFSPTKNS